MFYLHIRNLAFICYFMYFDFKVLDAKVIEVPMTGYQGKVLLIVNKLWQLTNVLHARSGQSMMQIRLLKSVYSGDGIFQQSS